MALHLEEISFVVAPGAHALALLDQAGWHVSSKLPVPDNITLVPLPPKSPELNPVENIWQFIRDNWLSNRITNILRGHPGALLLRLEQAHRHALENHVHRNKGLGLHVMINETWYYWGLMFILHLESKLPLSEQPYSYFCLH